ncbi:MAG: flagellar type III secretion system protein FlhB [Paracoccaceae bacterium]|nr:flagellar type III secretion system protein FlhB [Paracoccaceae bacterium]
MSGQESSGEKTHEATPRRLEKAREQGELPRSQDAQSFAAYLGFTLVVLIAGGWATRHLGATLTPFLDRPAEIAPLLMALDANPLAGEVLARLALPIFAILAAPAVLILVLLGAQRGIVFVPTRILPKLSRLSPVENARNKYGPRGLVEFVKSTVKLTALVTVLALVVWGERARLAQFVWVEAHQIGLLLDRQFRLIITGVLVVAAALAFFDLIWQRADHLRRMRMTHQDLKDEEKQAEGDPFLRAQRRERGRQIATNRMLLAVPEADVVVTNPSHYAVALKWDRDQGTAPVCLAKGADEIALAIRARAVEAAVPVRQDPPTARSLHALVEVGHEIRPEHYQAVAAAIPFAEEVRRKVRAREA